MTNIKLYVNGAHARAQVFGELVAGTIGITIDAKFNDEWNDLAKHLVCRNGKVVKTKLDFQNGFTVAPETMIAGGNLEIGFEGMSQDGKIVFPTVWASCGVVKDGANANDDYSADPTNPVWDQLEKQIGDLSKLETSAKSSIVDAVNEAANKDAKIPIATKATIGGVKAEPATEADTQPVRIGEDNKLYTVPGGNGGGGEKWETIIDYTVPEDCAEVFLKTDNNGNPFKLKRAIVTLLLFPAAGLTSEAWPVYTVDGTVDNVYRNNHYRYGAGYIPYETGMYRLTKFEVVQMPDGVHLLTVRETKTPAAYDEDGDVNASLAMAGGGFYERFHAKTLAPVVTEISAVGIGYYMAAIGAGTRIIMQGVRE